MSEIQRVEKKIHVVGGGTISPVREHLALSARAYGGAARTIAELASQYWTAPNEEVQLHLTKMADPQSSIETVGQLRNLAEDIVDDPTSKLVFWSPAVIDFEGTVEMVPSGLHAERLDSSQRQLMSMKAARKIVPMFRRDEVHGHMPPRKDLFAVAFKTTTGAEPIDQYSAGLKLLKQNSLNLVLANDTITRNNMVITPEEAPYHQTTDRQTALEGLVEMAYLRSDMHYTPTRVLPGEFFSWESPTIPDSLRTVVDHCIARGAYKPFLGVTTGHFSVKTGEGHMLSSRRKTNFNEIEKVGMVYVDYDAEGKITAYGGKPSAGARAQLEVYAQHPDKDCIVHFHCPLRPSAKITTVEQRPYECGSYECGANTADGLTEYDKDGIAAVMLDEHGPNVVFRRDSDPQKVIDFIEENFDLTAKTGGYIPVS